MFSFQEIVLLVTVLSYNTLEDGINYAKLVMEMRHGGTWRVLAPQGLHGFSGPAEGPPHFLQCSLGNEYFLITFEPREL